MAIITTEDCKAYRGISVNTHDTLIASLIAAAQDLIETDTGRRFDETTYTDEAYDGTGTGTLQLRQYPVTALTSVKVLDSAGGTTDIDIAGLRLKADIGLVHLAGSRFGRVVRDDFGAVEHTGFGHSPSFPRGFSNILVTYTAGYTSGTMPAGLKQVMFEIVADLYAQARSPANAAMQSESMGDYSYTRADAAAVYQTYRSRILRFRRGVV